MLGNCPRADPEQMADGFRGEALTDQPEDLLFPGRQPMHVGCRRPPYVRMFFVMGCLEEPEYRLDIARKVNLKIREVLVNSVYRPPCESKRSGLRHQKGKLPVGTQWRKRFMVCAAPVQLRVSHKVAEPSRRPDAVTGVMLVAEDQRVVIPDLRQNIGGVSGERIGRKDVDVSRGRSHVKNVVYDVFTGKELQQKLAGSLQVFFRVTESDELRRKLGGWLHHAPPDSRNNPFPAAPGALFEALVRSDAHWHQKDACRPLCCGDQPRLAPAGRSKQQLFGSGLTFVFACWSAVTAGAFPLVAAGVVSLPEALCQTICDRFCDACRRVKFGPQQQYLGHQHDGQVACQEP